MTMGMASDTTSINPLVPIGLSAAVVAGAVAFIEPWEGTRLDPYRDIAGVWTVCTGETRVPMRRYTRDECRAMLRAAITSTYGLGALRAVPALRHRPDQLVASISLTYNIGVGNFSSSTAARRFNAGDWKGGCNAFPAWNGITVPKPKPGQKCRLLKSGRYFCEVQGLVNRRAAERKLCLTGLS